MRIWIAALCLMLCWLGAAAGAERANPRSMSFPPLDFAIPKAERVVLENGTPVYLLQDRELPIVTVAALIRTGSVYDPADKSGLAQLTGSLLRGGGTAALTPGQLDEELEFMASGVESAFGSDSGSVTMTSLTKNLPRTLQLFSDVLFRPRFDEQRFEIARRQALEAIRRQNDDPKELGDRELHRALYAGHPLGQIPTAATLQAISRNDLLDFQQRFVRPDNLIVTVAGDFERSQIIGLLNRAIGSVRSSGPLALPTIPAVATNDTPAIVPHSPIPFIPPGI